MTSQNSDGHDRDRQRPDLRDRLPAVGNHHEGREELGDRRADVAGAEDAERGALAFRSEPLGHVGDADRERTAGDADAERREQECAGSRRRRSAAQVATAADSMTSVEDRRPPYWSVQMPSTRRISDPVRIGVPTSRPNWRSLSPRSFLICTPMMEKIVHTAKQTVKAIVESQRARL